MRDFLFKWQAGKTYTYRSTFRRLFSCSVGRGAGLDFLKAGAARISLAVRQEDDAPSGDRSGPNQKADDQKGAELTAGRHGARGHQRQIGQPSWEREE